MIQRIGKLSDEFVGVRIAGVGMIVVRAAPWQRATPGEPVFPIAPDPHFGNPQLYSVTKDAMFCTPYSCSTYHFMFHEESFRSAEPC